MGEKLKPVQPVTGTEKPKEQKGLKTFYTESEDEGTLSIVLAETLEEAQMLLATELEKSSDDSIDPSTLTLTEINPLKQKVLTLTPPNNRPFDRPRFL